MEKNQVPEKKIVNSILAHLRKIPCCFCWKEHGSPYSTAGLPDIICCINGMFVAFEVKTEDGVATDLQKATLSRIRNAGGTAHVVRSLDEVKNVLRLTIQLESDKDGLPPARHVNLASLAKAYARLRKLPWPEQMLISERYYKNEMPWRDEDQ